MNLTQAKATEQDKGFFWKHYCESMQPHIEQIWGWDEKWQKSDFDMRWLDCKNTLIQLDDVSIGYIQTSELEDEHYIMMLILLPQFRSRGIGRRLLTLIKDSTSKTYLGLRVFKTNKRALDFYHAQGFEEIANEGDFYYLRLALSQVNPSRTGKV